MKNKIMSLFRYASIVMSLLSWYTTYQGFQNTVFAGDRHAVLTAMMASLAIQTALLAGVLKYFPMIDSIKQKYRIEKQKRPEKKKQVWAKYFAEGFVISAILIFAIGTSITFSYISIVNNMYANDFAVNANIKLEQFMRTRVTEMETDNEEYLKVMRVKIVEEMEKNGESIINQSVKNRAKKYANTIGKLTEAGRQETLIDLHGKNGVSKEKIGKYTIKKVSLQYVKMDYEKMIKNKPSLLNSRFLERMRRKINDLNNSYYIDYCMSYDQYSDALKRYNLWIRQIKKGNVPSLEEMKGLKDNSIKIEKSIKTLIEKIEDFPAGGYAVNSTKELKAGAKSNVSSLLTAVEDLENSITDLINNSYGKDSLSFAEIISAFGSKSTKMEELERAKDQMLEMQGIMLQGKDGTVTTEGSQTDLREITDLMESLERYVTAVTYNTRIQGLKEQVEINYNIVSDLEKEQEEPKKEEEKWIEFKFLMTGSAISKSQDISSKKEEKKEKDLVETQGVITISPEEWTDMKRIQMTEFTGLIFDHPVNLYCPQVKVGTLEKHFLGTENKEDSKEEKKKIQETYQERFEKLQNDAYEYRKSFLDTSDSEKAYNMLFRKKYFPYTGKAQLSAAFAIFLDVGAFAIGFLMYRMEKTNGNKKKQRKIMFRNSNF